MAVDFELENLKLKFEKLSKLEGIVHNLPFTVQPKVKDYIKRKYKEFLDEYLGIEKKKKPAKVGVY